MIDSGVIQDVFLLRTQHSQVQAPDPPWLLTKIKRLLKTNKCLSCYNMFMIMLKQNFFLKIETQETENQATLKTLK